MKLTDRKRVIIIGAGAAGLMAAGHAAAQGAEVIVLEKMHRPALKLRITGKGRCNITNIAPLPEFIERFGRNGRFLHQAFSRFFSADTVSFFNSLGVETVEERGGRIFPQSGKAEEVVNALLHWVEEAGVEIRCGTSAKRLEVDDGAITGVHVITRTSDRAESDKETASTLLPADAVIVATGGASYPATGSSGDGYRLAEAVGHTLKEVRPALIPLVTTELIGEKLEGLSLRNVSAKLWIKGKKKAELFGEMLFTAFGLSGPIILTLSGQAVDAIRNKKPVEISIDLKPALDDVTLDKRLMRDFSTHSRKAFRSIMKTLLPRLLIPVCIEKTGIPEDKTGSQITGEERKRLRMWLKDFRLEIKDFRPIKEAIITAGGVSLKEIDPYTMESRKIKGLYFAGELLDIHGDTGGYNLQAAFSTGVLAGRSIV